MRIGVITYSETSDNYGQILQCYALQKYLQAYGHDVYLIRYTPCRLSLLGRVLHNLSFSRVVKKLGTIIDKFNPEIKREQRLKTLLETANKELNKEREFNLFKREHLNCTPYEYTSIEELRRNPPQADMYICGSDQIWRGVCDSANNLGWFLSFGSKDTIRISYAASMGGRVLSHDDTKLFARELRKFDAVSVRETFVADNCKKAGREDVKVVLDPTILPTLDTYKELFKDSSFSACKPYMFIYVLNIRYQEELYWQDIKEYIDTHNLDVKVVYSSGHIPARSIIEGVKELQATIPEWLSYIYNAECVVTTSFHGVVFCIQMNKPFLVIPLTNEFSGGNVRIFELLANLGLSGRVYNPDISLEEQISSKIEWSVVNKKLTDLKYDSVCFLREALNLKER